LNQHRARKRFGQNFLEDGGIIALIARSISVQDDDHIVEIGPGKGALTNALINPKARLDAIELDRDLIPLLEQQFGHYPNFSIIQTDALQFDFAKLSRNNKPLRIVGNLPYNISTPLIFHLLSHQQLIQDMHFMLQLEVVQRLAAKPGTKSYGRLTVMTQYYCDVEMLFEVPPEAFNPKPKVQSAIVRLTPHNILPSPAKDTDKLQFLLKQAFGQRRKTLKNTLKNVVSAETLNELGIDPGARAETLTLAQFVQLSDTISR